MAGLDWTLVLLVVVAATAGGLVQSVVGIGLGLLTTPVVALAEPSLVPVLPLWLGLGTAGTMMLQEHAHVDWRALLWTTPARVPGVVLGAWLVGVATDAGIALGVGLMVLLAVALTARGVVVPFNATSLSAAGFVSGVTGTATAIGGPPIAIVFAGREPAVVRSTLAVFFFLGVLLGLGGLWVAGEVTAEASVLALVCMPGVLLGILLGTFLRPRVPRDQFRAGVLVVCALSAVALLVRSVA